VAWSWTDDQHFCFRWVKATERIGADDPYQFSAGAALESVWEMLLPIERACFSKSDLAECLLKAARAERDPARLHAFAKDRCDGR
jgi:hypothetical protein